MFPQCLLLCQNSRLRRLYHHAAEGIECEIKPCSTVAEALVQLVVSPAGVIIIEESVPIFEITVFLDVLAKKAEWSKAALVVIGFEGRHHLFPRDTRFCSGESQFVSLVKETCDTL